MLQTADQYKPEGKPTGRQVRLSGENISFLKTIDPTPNNALTVLRKNKIIVDLVINEMIEVKKAVAALGDEVKKLNNKIEQASRY